MFILIIMVLAVLKIDKYIVIKAKDAYKKQIFTGIINIRQVILLILICNTFTDHPFDFTKSFYLDEAKKSKAKHNYDNFCFQSINNLLK